MDTSEMIKKCDDAATAICQVFGNDSPEYTKALELLDSAIVRHNLINDNWSESEISAMWEQ